MVHDSVCVWGGGGEGSSIVLKSRSTQFASTGGMPLHPAISTIRRHVLIYNFFCKGYLYT